MTFLIEFRFPEGTLYAGKTKDGLGWAPWPATALEFETAEKAGICLAHGYGPSVRYAHIVTSEEIVERELGGA